MVAPAEQQWRALARSSPWLWRTAHFDLVRTGADPVRLEAWLDRRNALRVEGGDGAPMVQELQRSRSSWFGWDEQGNADSGTSEVPFPWEATVTFDADGLVAVRPPGHEVAEELMWRDYRWVAMLDPVELADGSDERLGPATLVSELSAGERHGRLTWWAVVREGPGYDPRCTCCPLLDGQLADRIYDAEGGPRAPRLPRPTDLPTRWLVGLDRATGIVVSLQPLDGQSSVGGFEVVLHAVDETVQLAAPAVR
ncbi:MAG: hypothetical protein QM582_13210 [Micropruina sp.]|uniref:hypothetical protein n=1 Tax=Micropruina sp. TaxID=2737536 RepID=UPI0039E36336